VPGEVVVTFRTGTSGAHARTLHARVALGSVGRVRGLASQVVTLAPGVSPAVAVRRYERFPSVVAAEPNRIATPLAVPADPRFDQQWSMQNTGQPHRITEYGLDPVTSLAGLPDRDIDATDAWDVTLGSADVVVAVIDSGVELNHPDLAGAMWENELERDGVAGVDDDGNGYVDDVHGYDFRGDDGDPTPPSTLNASHGTHVAGIIAAQHDGNGVAGVCPGCRIMALRFDYSLGQELEAIAYAVANGADIINMSFGGGVWSPGERAAIADAGAAGVLTVASAGNSSADNDIAFYPDGSHDFAPAFPTSYDLPTILSVAASDDHDRYGALSECGPASLARWRCSFTSWGNASVDVAAPGVDILSDVATGGVFGDLDVWDGTSMAAPHVTGIAGLVKSANPGYTALDLKNAIMNSVDQPASLDVVTRWAQVVDLPTAALDGDFTRTQGRVNAMAALTGSTDDATPLVDGTIEGAVALGSATTRRGRVTWPADVNDVYRKDLKKGHRYEIELDGPANADLDLWVWSPSADEIFQFTEGCFRRRGACPAVRAVSASSSADERVVFRVRKSATYAIQVNGWYSSGAYTLRIRPA
jgi:subtilisin family serine protease